MTQSLMQHAYTVYLPLPNCEDMAEVAFATVARTYVRANELMSVMN